MNADFSRFLPTDRRFSRRTWTVLLAAVVLIAAGCGWPGAHAFCRDRGYERALGFEVFNPGRTYLMSGDTFCNGPTCTAFQSVTCKMAAGQASTLPPMRPATPQTTGSA